MWSAFMSTLSKAYPHNVTWNSVMAWLYMVSSSQHMDCSPPGSSVHGIIQPRILEKEIPFPSPPGDLSNPGIEPVSPALAGGFFLSLSHLGSPSTQSVLSKHIWNK